MAWPEVKEILQSIAAKVADGASDFLVALFDDNGRHVRAAIGVAELPLNAAVELELVARVRL